MRQNVVLLTRKNINAASVSKLSRGKAIHKDLYIFIDKHRGGQLENV